MALEPASQDIQNAYQQLHTAYRERVSAVIEEYWVNDMEVGMLPAGYEHDVAFHKVLVKWGISLGLRGMMSVMAKDMVELGDE